MDCCRQKPDTKLVKYDHDLLIGVHGLKQYPNTTLKRNAYSLLSPLM